MQTHVKPALRLYEATSRPLTRRGAVRGRGRLRHLRRDRETAEAGLTLCATGQQAQTPSVLDFTSCVC